MPPKRTLRKRYNRRRRKYYKKSKLPAFGGNPVTKLVRLRYCEEVSLNPTAGAIAYNDFSANGMYDPNVTGTGHKPLGFDQAMTYYDHFTVIGAKITAQYVSPGLSNIIPGYLTVGLFDAFGVPATYSNIAHMLESRQVSMSPATTSATSYVRSNLKEGRVAKHFSAKKFFNRSPKGDSTLKGSASANPSDQAYFSVILGSIGGTDAGAANVLVTIDYIALLSEPKILSQS